MLWGGWGERKRESEGHDALRALSIFSIIAISIGIPRLSQSPSLLISGSVSLLALSFAFAAKTAATKNLSLALRAREKIERDF